METNEAVKILENGGIGVLPTDTLYGLVGRASSREAVERIYRVRKRSPDKPQIVLISSVNDLKLFGIDPKSKEAALAGNYWPGKVSVILPCDNPELEYLHRGTKSIAFRVPDMPELVELLKKTGPLVAPSANHEGELPSLTIDEAKKYFGNDVDFYRDDGLIESEPSTILKIEGNKTIIVREGAVKVNLF